MAGSGRRRLMFLGLLAVADIALLAALALPGAAPPRANVAEETGSSGIASRLSDILVARGLPAALDTLERLAGSDSTLLREGHQLAHALGRRALMASGGDDAILGQCRPAFASGCFHGVVEALVKLRGRVDMAELQRMCLGAGRPESAGPVYECTHGVGHGVLGAVGLNVTTALHHCDALTRPRLMVSCHQGVFMEAITVALAGRQDHASHLHRHGHGAVPSLAIDPADPYSPCVRVAAAYAESCWLFQGFVILRSVGFDASRALRLCDAAPAGRADRCYESVGHQIAGLFQRSDSWVAEQCGKGQSERAAKCASGAALAFVAMDWSGQRVSRFCGLVPRDWAASCSRTAAEELALVS